MAAPAAILSQRPVQIVIGAVIILAIVYFMGRKSGKTAASQPNWWQRLIGDDTPKQQDIPTVTVGGQPAQENVQSVTDAIYAEMQLDVNLIVGGWFSDTDLNNAFSQFNNLSHTGKASVINDWNSRYLGTDRPGVLTGNHGTLRQEIAYLYPSTNSRPSEVAIAYRWMQDYAIQ